MKNKKNTIIRVLLLAAAIIFIVVGIFRGEAVTVLNKAVRICLECIGIG